MTSLTSKDLIELAFFTDWSLPIPAAFDEFHEGVILNEFGAFPHRQRNRQRKEPPDISPQTLQFDNEFILRRVEDAVCVQDNEVNEDLLFTRDGLSRHVRRCVENAGQSGVTIEVRPDVAVILGDGQQIGDAMARTINLV